MAEIPPSCCASLVFPTVHLKSVSIYDFLCSVTYKNLMKLPPHWKMKSKSVFLGRGHSDLAPESNYPL